MHNSHRQHSFEQEAPADTLVQSLLQSALNNPQKTAFLNSQQSIDYQSLLFQACQIAETLIHHGIGAGDRVAVILPRCLEVPIAVYGIWLSGAAYVPIDPAASDAEQASMIEHCEVSGLVTHPHLKARLSNVIKNVSESLNLVLGLDCEDVVPSMTWQEIQEIAVETELPVVDPQSLAYILHTSGSTGKPKGIMHSHASALAYTRLTADACAITSTDVIACHSALHTDMSTLGLFAAPFTGASAVIIPDAHIRMPASLSALLHETKVSVWYSVPLALMQLLQNGVLEKRTFTALRLVIYAGEAISPKYIKKLLMHWPMVRFSNHYGPAETNVCTYFDLPADAVQSGYLDTGNPIPIGKPWGPNKIVLADSDLNPVAGDASGEILVNSPTTMCGYWKEPDLTVSALVNIKTEHGNATYYRTGDIAEYDAVGNLRLIGRKDRQVKVRGHRVELDSIEHQLAECEQVKQNAAFTIKTKDSLQIHIAVIPNSDTVKQVYFVDYCQRIIHHGTLPFEIHIMDSFPTTSSGKIDRRALANQFSESNPND